MRAQKQNTRGGTASSKPIEEGGTNQEDISDDEDVDELMATKQIDNQLNFEKNLENPTLSYEYTHMVVQRMKEDNNIDLADLNQLHELIKNPVLTEKIIIDASDKVFNKIIKHKDLSKLPNFIKSSNYVEANKNKRD